MNISEFYSLFSATCFGLVGIWWNVVQGHKEWFQDEIMKSISGGIYLSFLIPGLMGLGAQIGGSDSSLWRLAFTIGAGFGIIFTLKLLNKTKNKHNAGPLQRNRWLVVAVYGFILLGSLGFDEMYATYFDIKPIQVEALWLCLNILLAHGLAWEFLTESNED